MKTVEDIKKDKRYWENVYKFMLEHNCTKEDAENNVVLYYQLFNAKPIEYRYCKDCRKNNLVDTEYNCCDECGWSEEVEAHWEEYWDDDGA